MPVNVELKDKIADHIKANRIYLHKDTLCTRDTATAADLEQAGIELSSGKHTQGHRTMHSNALQEALGVDRDMLGDLLMHRKQWVLSPVIEVPSGTSLSK
jgi:hypothetical protein